MLNTAIEFEFKALYLSLRGNLKSTVSKEEHMASDNNKNNS